MSFCVSLKLKTRVEKENRDLDYEVLDDEVYPEMVPADEYSPYEDVEAKTSTCRELMNLFTNKLYMLLVFGYASYAAVTQGIAFFGPEYIQTGFPCDSRWGFSQSSADFVFGGVVAGTGALATPFGGSV